MDEFKKIATDIPEKDKVVIGLLREKRDLIDDLLKIRSHNKDVKISFVYKDSQWYMRPFDAKIGLNLCHHNIDYSSVIKELERVVIKRLSEIEEELDKYLK